MNEPGKAIGKVHGDLFLQLAPFYCHVPFTKRIFFVFLHISSLLILGIFIFVCADNENAQIDDYLLPSGHSLYSRDFLDCIFTMYISVVVFSIADAAHD